MKNKETGQSMTEYVAIVALVAVVSIPAFTRLGQSISSKSFAIAQIVDGEGGQTTSPTNPTPPTPNPPTTPGFENDDIATMLATINGFGAASNGDWLGVTESLYTLGNQFNAAYEQWEIDHAEIFQPAEQALRQAMYQQVNTTIDQLTGIAETIETGANELTQEIQNEIDEGIDYITETITNFWVG